VSVRKGELENVERNRDKSLGITVYVGSQRGNASTSDFSRAAIERTVQAAYDIARFTAQDPVAGLPDPDDVAPATQPRPGPVPSLGRHQREAARTGAALRARRLRHRQAHHQQRRRRRLGAAKPFLQRPHARLSRRLCQLAPLDLGRAHRRQGRRHAARRLVQLHALGQELASPEAVGRYAAERALSRLKSRKIAPSNARAVRVARWPPGLLGGYVQATSGGALYRKSTFLLDSLGKQVFRTTSTCVEDPFVKRGKGSAPSTRKGVRTAPARWWTAAGSRLFPEQLLGPQAGHEDHRQSPAARTT
jgi:PmbA protein